MPIQIRHLVCGHSMKNKVGQFVGATWQSSHVFGDCLVNHHARLFFVNIPKCASSWAKQYLASNLNGNDQKLFWDHGNFADPEHDHAVSFLKIPLDLATYQPVIFLRDLQQRWLSHRPFGGVIIPADLESIETIIHAMPGIIHDEHLAPQSDFIMGLDWVKAVYFLCDDSLHQRFEFWLAGQGLTGYHAGAKQNVSPRDLIYEQYRRKWNLLYDHTAVKYAFDNLYREDIDLMRETPWM